MLYKDTHTGEIIDAETLKKEIENSGEYPCFIDGIIDELIDAGAIAKVPRTYGEAIASGYITADRKYSRGYISRKTDINNQPIKIAAGKRKGDIYINIPSYDSTRYHYRLYLKRGM